MLPQTYQSSTPLKTYNNRPFPGTVHVSPALTKTHCAKQALTALDTMVQRQAKMHKQTNLRSVDMDVGSFLWKKIVFCTVHHWQVADRKLTS